MNGKTSKAGIGLGLGKASSSTRWTSPPLSPVIVAIAAAAAVGAPRPVGATRWVARMVRYQERATHRVAPTGLATTARHQAAYGGAQAGVPAPHRSARVIAQF